MITGLLILFGLGVVLFLLGYFFQGPLPLRILILSLGILLLLSPILAWSYFLILLATF